MPGMNINISANVQNAVQGLNTVQQQLAATAAASNAMGGSFASGVKGIDQAGFALTNLGRVAQDAPFGFIAIQNNLNPLLESFQRLQKETGGVGGTFKALASSLLGAGGVGLALSVVSSILIKFPDLFSSLTKEEIAARDALKAYNEEVAKEQGALQTELTRMSSLIQIARDYSESSTARASAIKELQKEYPGYLQNINQENINSQQTQQAIDKLTDALTRKAKVQAITNLLTKAEEDLYKAQSAPLEDNLTTWNQITTLVKNFGNLGGAGLDAVTTATDNQNKSVTGLQTNIGKLQAQLDALTRGQAENNEFQLLNPEKLGKTKEKIDQVAETLRKLAIDRDELAKNPLLSFDEKDQKAFDLIDTAINRLRDLKVAEKNPILISLRAQLDEAATQVQLDKFHALMKKTGVSDVMQIPIEASFKLIKGAGGITAEENLLKEIDDFTKKFKNKDIQLKALSFSFDKNGFEAFKKDAIANVQKQADIMTDVISSIFEKAGDATSIKGFFTSMGQVLGEGLKALGKNLIETSTLIASIKKALNVALAGNPIAGIGVGVGLMALGNLLEKSLPKFADGGIAYGPTVGVFGEYAGAKNNPEVVAPLNKLKDLIGGGQSATPATIRVEGRLTGNDMYISNSRTASTFERLYGKKR